MRDIAEWLIGGGGGRLKGMWCYCSDMVVYVKLSLVNGITYFFVVICFSGAHLRV